MMSTRTPGTGRLWLAAACGMALVSPTDAADPSSPTPESRAQVRERIDELYRDRGLSPAYGPPEWQATQQRRPTAPRRLQPAGRDGVELVGADAPEGEVAPAPSVKTLEADVAPPIESAAPPRTTQRVLRRRAGRSSMRRDWAERRRQHGYTPSNVPTPDPLTSGGPGTQSAPSTRPGLDPKPIVDSRNEPANDVAPVAGAKTSGDVEPKTLPRAEESESRPPSRGFVLFGRKRDRDDEPEGKKKRSFLGRLFGGDKDEDEEDVQVAGPDEQPIERKPIEEPGLEEPSSGRPFVPPAPADVADAKPQPERNPFELPVPAEDEGEDGFDAPVPPAPETVADTEKPTADDFDNPFPELSEEEADEKPMGETPFEDLAIEEPAGEETPGAEKPGDNPFETEPEPETIAEDSPKPEATDENPFDEPVIRPRGSEEPEPKVEPKRVASKPSLTAPPEADVDPRIKRIRERESRSGLKGFCPVALRDDRQLVDARNEFAVVHKSRTYHLSSREAMEKFESDPQKYAPVASGHDVILLTVEGRRVEGTLDHAVWYKDRLHLFSSRDTLARFVRSLNRDPFEGETRPASNEVPSRETKPVSRPARRAEAEERVEDAVVAPGESGPRIELPAPSEDEAEENPFE